MEVAAARACAVLVIRGKMRKNFFHKNTGDLQDDNLQKYNVRYCNHKKNGNRHETMKNREKNRKEQGRKTGGTDPKTMRRGPRSPRQRKNPPRRAGDTRTNLRLGFQPSQILRAEASKRKKRSRYPCGGLAGDIGDGRIRILALRSSLCDVRLHRVG
jgi:hypothetical protein